nr:ribonuclease H-like domain-containing protein [Tanacetum cinerariifolium]
MLQSTPDSENDLHIAGGSWKFLADLHNFEKLRFVDLGYWVTDCWRIGKGTIVELQLLAGVCFTLISRLDVSDPLHLHPNDSVALTIVSAKLKGTKNHQVWLNALWKQFDALIESPRCTCNAVGEFKKHNQLMKLMQFLMGLDMYMQIRSSILSRETLSDVRSAYATISSEDSHRVASGSIVGTSQRSQTSANVSNVPNKGKFQRNQTSNNTPRPNNVNNNRQGGGSCFTDEQLFTLISLIKDNSLRKECAGQNLQDLNMKNVTRIGVNIDNFLSGNNGNDAQCSDDTFAAHNEQVTTLEDNIISEEEKIKNTRGVRLRGLGKTKQRKECLQEVRNTKAKREYL